MHIIYKGNVHSITGHEDPWGGGNTCKALFFP